VPVPLMVVDTARETVAEANPAFASVVGRPSVDTTGRAVDEIVDEASLPGMKALLSGLRSGTTHSWAGRLELRGGSGSVPTEAWAVPLGPVAPHEAALVSLAAADDDTGGVFDPSRLQVSRFVFGVLDHDWRFCEVAVNSASVLGWPPDGPIRSRLQDIVSPEDAPGVLASLGRSSLDHEPAILQVRVRGVGGEWLAARLTVTPLCRHPAPRFAVGLCLLAAPDGTGAEERVAHLEGHLLRIAAEVRAAGIPAGEPPAELDGLTDRQREILKRLSGGQRVGTIARELFISPTTVRNHLSAIYKRFGVGSQADLLEKLRHEQIWMAW